jgi:WD40 repeat protein
MLSGVSITHSEEAVGKKLALDSLFFVPGHPLIAGSITYSLSERRLVRGILIHVHKGGIYFWSTENGRLDHSVSFSKHILPERFDISRDGSRIVVIFSDHTQPEKRSLWLGCYSLLEKKWLWKSKWGSNEKEVPQVVRFLPNGRSILTLGYFSVWYYDAETGHRINEQRALLKEYPVYRWALRSSYVSPSGRYLVIWQEKPYEGLARGMNKFVTVWDLTAGKEVARWKKPDCECQIATFTPDEQSVVFGCKDGYVRERSIKKQSLVRELKTSGEVVSVVFSPNGRYLAANSGRRDITVFDYATQRTLQNFHSPGWEYTVIGGEQYPMAFSSDSELMALWDKGRVCIYSTITWEEKWCVVPRPPDLGNQEVGVSP